MLGRPRTSILHHNATEFHHLFKRTTGGLNENWTFGHESISEDEFLVAPVLSLDNLLHISLCGLTSFERSILEEFEESLHVSVKNTLSYPNSSFQAILDAYGRQSAPSFPCPVEKLLVLLLPILSSGEACLFWWTGKRREY
jgi:hypothetical protein